MPTTTAMTALESSLETIEALKNAAGLIVQQNNESLQKIERLLTSTQAKIKALTSLDTNPTQSDLHKLKTIEQHYYNELATLLALTTREKLKTIDRWLKDAMALIAWRERQIEETTYQDGDQTITLTEEPVYYFTDDLTNEYLSIISEDSSPKPDWFTTLPTWEQTALKEKIKNAEKIAKDSIYENPSSPRLTRSQSTSSLSSLDSQEIEGNIKEIEQSEDASFNLAFARAMGTPPATSRKFPGLANFSKHTMTISSPANQDMLSYYSYRSSTQTPFEIKHRTERDRILTMNLNQFSQASSDDAKPYLTHLASSLKIQNHGDRTHQINASSLTDVHDRDGLPFELTSSGLDSGPTIGISGLVTNIAELGLEGKIVRDNAHAIKNLHDAKPEIKIFYSNHAISFRPLTKAIKLDKAARDTLNVAKEKLNYLFRKMTTKLSFNDDIVVDRKESTIAALTNWLEKPNTKNYEHVLSGLSAMIFQKEADLEKTRNENNSRAINSELKKLLFLHSVRDYIELIHRSPSVLRERNPNLFMTALEEIIVGRTLGSCKSGKDRKAMAIIQRDTMTTQFFKSNGKHLANYFDQGQERETFVNSFSLNVLSQHQASNASNNWLRTQGTKNLRAILPKDIQRKILALDTEKRDLSKEDASFFEIQKHMADRNSIQSTWKARFVLWLRQTFPRFNAWLNRREEARTAQTSPDTTVTPPITANEHRPSSTASIDSTLVGKERPRSTSQTTRPTTSTALPQPSLRRIRSAPLLTNLNTSHRNPTNNDDASSSSSPPPSPRSSRS